MKGDVLMLMPDVRLPAAALLVDACADLRRIHDAAMAATAPMRAIVAALNEAVAPMRQQAEMLRAITAEIAARAPRGPWGALS